MLSIFQLQMHKIDLVLIPDAHTPSTPGGLKRSLSPELEQSPKVEWREIPEKVLISPSSIPIPEFSPYIDFALRDNRAKQVYKPVS